jgi:probable HAF family extracellular repeat protein
MATYQIVELGLPKGCASSTGIAINELGQVLYSASLPSGSTLPKLPYAILWDHGIMHVLGKFNAKSLNNRGQVVGARTVKPPRNFLPLGLPSSQACLFSHGRLTDLPQPPPTLLSLAAAINDAGVSVGNIYAGTPPDIISKFAYVWANENRRLDIPSSFSLSEAVGINNRDQVVGEAFYEKSSPEWARGITQAGMVWEQSESVILPPLAGWNASSAVAINNQGIAVGVSRRQRQQIITKQQACLWRGRQVQSLAALCSGGTSLALGINDHMQIVGNSHFQTGKTYFHAFLWEAGKIQDLNRLVRDGSGWTLISAMGINNRGDILCNGVYEYASRQNLRAVLLQPL